MNSTHNTEANTMKRIKRITSHVGLSRYLSYVESTGKVILRVPSIPSPYAYSPDHQVYRDEQGRNVIVVETAHKQYDVFAVPADIPLLTPESENQEPYVGSLDEELDNESFLDGGR
jgi:hypothetical protein